MPFGIRTWWGPAGAWPVLLLCTVLAGCGANMRAAIGTAEKAWDGGRSVADQDPARLNSNFEYLRVQTGRQAGLMVRAESEWTVHGKTELWFSADRALLRLANGRLVGFSEGTRAWQVTHSEGQLDWRAAASGQAQTIRWTVDQQPGYRIGRRVDRVIELSLAGPASHALQGALPANARWFVERDAQHSGATSWYAVDLRTRPPRVIYGQTCLAPDWCLSWQAWPPKAQP